MKVVPFTIPVPKDSTVVVQEEVLPYFYRYLHRHKEVQLTWILEGTGTLIAGDYMQNFGPQEMYIIGSNQPHLFKSNDAYFEQGSKKQIHAVTIYFNPNGYIDGLLNVPELKALSTFLQSTSAGIQVPSVYVNNLAQLIKDVQKSSQTDRIIHFLQLLSQLAKIDEMKILSSAPINVYSEMEGIRMKDIYEYTMENFSTNIKLQNVASVAHLTPQAFCRYFKKHTKKTYVTFLNEIRINAACKKIAGGAFDSYAHVAYQSGFSSVVTFNRVFKHVVGKSPRIYQKQFLKQTL